MFQIYNGKGTSDIFRYIAFSKQTYTFFVHPYLGEHENALLQSCGNGELDEYVLKTRLQNTNVIKAQA